ncbi:MAG: pyridoxamine 5'-phosphate oxidase family protein [Sediminicola sp.]
MEALFFNELREELQQGAVTKGHPFRYGTLGTVGLDKLARLRMVVIRKLSEDLKVSIFTDARSKKVSHIKENNRVSLLFYHPAKLLQVRMEGLATITEEQGILERMWREVPKEAQTEYTAKAAPGSSIPKGERTEYLTEGHHFCILEVHPFKIEYLKLQRPEHVRIRFSKKEDQWKGEFLVP